MVLNYSNSALGEGNKCTKRAHQEHTDTNSTSWWQVEPAVGRVADGLASRVDRLRALGNGQVPAVVRFAWRNLS